MSPDRRMNRISGKRYPNVVVLIPVYNDWDALQVLLGELVAVSTRLEIKPRLVVIDDGSEQSPPSPLLGEMEAAHFREIELIRLHLNIGHQSALAVGLSEIHHRHDCDVVIVMDADGEDRPADIEPLIRAHSENPRSIVVAKRSKRAEGLWFRGFYRLYKIVFRAFVGTDLDFGNFCLIPSALLGRLAFDPMSWNHLAAAISRSRVDVVRIQSNRGKRFYGKSSMNLERLISHGLSAVSVFLDIAMIRVLIVSAVIMLFALVGVLTVIWLRLFTELAIPGWATNAVGLLSIIGLQGLILSTIASFLVLRSRSAVSMIPAIDGLKYIEKVERIRGDE